MSEYFPTPSDWLRILGRSLLFIVGGIAALANALISNSYGRSLPLVLSYADVSASLALVVASVVFFFLATFGKAGGRWTIRYGLAWLAYVVAYCIVGLIATVT